MALIIVFHRQPPGPDDAANYNVEVLIGDGTNSGSRTIERGTVDKHNRDDGWVALVQKYLNERKT